MNCILMCEVTVSKKFEKFCEDGEPISIQIDTIKGNKGRAMLRMVSKSGSDLGEMAKIGETSLILKVTGAEEDVPTLENGMGGVSLFSGGAKIDGSTATEKAVMSHSTADSKLGDPHPLQRETIRQAVAAELKRLSEQNRTGSQPHPSPVAPAERPAAAPAAREEIQEEIQEAVQDDTCILSYEDLIGEIGAIKDIDREVEALQQVPRDSAGRQIAIKVAEAVPKMSKHAYVKNLMKSCLIVQDIQLSAKSCLAFQPGEVCDLSRFPAKLVRDSNDLKWCLETGKVVFVKKSDFVKYIELMSGLVSGPSGLPVYGSVEEAASGMKRSDAPSVATDLDVQDRDGDVPFGDDKHIDKLVRSMPQ